MFRLRSTNHNPDDLPFELQDEYATISALLSAVYSEGADWAHAVARSEPTKFLAEGPLSYIEGKPDHAANGLVIEVMVDGEWRELLGLTHRTVQTVVTESRIL